MPDVLLIADLTAQARIGVFDWERKKPQAVWVDLELAIDAAKAAKQDDIKQAIDYAALVTAVRQIARSRSYRLLETLAEAIAGLVLSKFRTSRVKVRVKKRALPGIGYAAVEVERTRRVGLPRRKARAAGL